MGFVLEGPDGAGKSTLADHLADTFGLTVHHFGPPSQPPLREYLHWLVALDEEGHRRVIDRFHLGESVYGPIYRGTRKLDLTTLAAIEWALMVRGYTLIHVTQSLARLVSVLEDRGDDMVKIPELTKVHEAYWNVMSRDTFMPQVTYDWRFSSLPSWCTSLERLSEMYYQQLGAFWGTGALIPKVILVGERINPRKLSEARGVPFACGTGADWLCEAIVKLDWQRDVYLTNARKVHGDEQMVRREIRWIRARCHELGFPTPEVVALGHMAARVLRDHGIQHTQVHHPSYHRRFKYGNGPKHYADVLRGAVSDSLGTSGALRPALPPVVSAGDGGPEGTGSGQVDPRADRGELRDRSGPAPV